MEDMADMVEEYFLEYSGAFDNEWQDEPYHHGFWRMANGKLIRISEMDDRHLLNAGHMLIRKVGNMPAAIRYELEYRGLHDTISN